MTWTYRDAINSLVDNSWIFTTRKKEWSIRLDRWFYISKDLLIKVKFVWGAPMEEIHRANMETFADFVWRTRQSVRDSIINNWKYIFLRKWYYNIDSLVLFLETFNWIKNEK